MLLRSFVFALVISSCLLFLHSCTYNYDPMFDKENPAANTGNNALPYKSLVNRLQSVDEKRMQDYEMLRKQIDSSHNTLMRQMQAMQDSTVAMQHSNNQQIINLRKEVDKLTKLIYGMLAISLLALGYFLAEGLKKYKNRQRRIAQNISYSHVEDVTPTVLANPAK